MCLLKTLTLLSYTFSNVINFSPRLIYEALLKVELGYSVGPDLLPSIFWNKACYAACPPSIYPV